ncbi:MAG: nucleotidyltransferase domain-containing protein [Egibacteraceae bacterium]
MPPQSLPAHVERVATELGELPGVVAVVLGGSRATGTHRPDSDWDLGVYYRASARPLNPDEVRGLGYEGYVSELGEWGPIVHGGAWLSIDSTPVDVLFRDLDIVEPWLRQAQRGHFEVLTQNGHIVGAPTYLPVGELALCQPISGEVPRPSFPDALADAAPRRWEGRAGVSLVFADGHARLGDAVCCAGMLADAVLCVAHARLARDREWVLNEKRLIMRAGLQGVQPLLARAGSTSVELTATVARISEMLGIGPFTIREPSTPDRV